MAALIAVPLPFKMPVTEVVNVIAGVWPPEEDPANPFAEAIDIDVTYPERLGVPVN